MTLRPLALSLLLVGPALAAQTAPLAGPVGRAGDVVLSVNGGFWPAGAGARYYVADAISVGVAVDRTTFAASDPSSALAGPDATGSRAFNASASVEWEAALTSWLTLMSGGQVYAQRQDDEVVLGLDASRQPVLDEEGRRIGRVGIGTVARLEARVAGPLRLGFVGSYMGLGLERTRGGTISDGANVVLLEAAPRTNVTYRGGSNRFYVAVRF